MDALDVITLAEAKEFLVVDFEDRNAEIEALIKSSVAIVEKYTNVMLYERTKTYEALGSCLEIYDYPISFTDTELKTRQHTLSVSVYGLTEPNTSIDTTVGFTEVPEDYSPLVEAAKKLITYGFENKDVYSVSLPIDVQMLINPFRRSATF